MSRLLLTEDTLGQNLLGINYRSSSKFALHVNQVVTEKSSSNPGRGSFT